MNAAQSAPGSTYGGAGSPKGLTEGFRKAQRAAKGKPMGELAARKG